MYDKCLTTLSPWVSVQRFHSKSVTVENCTVIQGPRDVRSLWTTPCPSSVALSARKILAASSLYWLIPAKVAIQLTIFRTPDCDGGRHRSNTRHEAWRNSRGAREPRCSCCCFQVWFRPGESPAERRSWLHWWADSPSRWCRLEDQCSPDRRHRAMFRCGDSIRSLRRRLRST